MSESGNAAEKNGRQKRSRVAESAKEPVWPVERQVAPAPNEGGGDLSDSEAEALDALRLVTTHSTTVDAASNGAVSSTSSASPGTRGGRSWRAGLEALKQQRPIVWEHSKTFTQEELLARVRESIDNGDWSNLMVGRAPKNKTIEYVVRELAADEMGKVLQAFSEKYQSAPSVAQILCAPWILQFLEHRAEVVVDNALGNATLRKLLKVLEQRLAGDPGNEALACHGKWRLMAEWRSVALQERAAAQSESAQKVVISAEDEADASDTGEEEDDEGEGEGEAGAGGEESD